MHPTICREGFHRAPTRSIGRSHGHSLLCVGLGKRLQRLRRGTSWRLRYFLKSLCVLQPGLHVLDKRVVTQGNLLTKTLPDTRVALAIIHKLHLALTRCTIAPATRTQQPRPGQPGRRWRLSHGRPVTPQWPRARFIHHSRPHRIENHIARKLQKIRAGRAAGQRTCRGQRLGKSNALLPAACGRTLAAAGGYGPWSRYAVRRQAARLGKAWR